MSTIRNFPRRRAGVALGLLFLLGPASDLADAGLGTWRVAAFAAGLAVFSALYLSLLPPAAWIMRFRTRTIPTGIAALALLAAAMLAAGAPHSFLYLYVYVVAAAGVLLSALNAMRAIGAVATGVAFAAPSMGLNSSTTGSIVLTVVAIGAMMLAFGRQIRTNQDLLEARGELARLAVSEERLRIARDLHDLLGHSLSVIALKSELAAKLMERDGARAAGELADVQRVTRQALVEVREAVQGYRRLALADAVDGARTALAAAGIELRVDDADVELPPDVESVLAWAVREATTNVVRHSGARACAIRLFADGTRAEVEVSDDGAAEVGTEASGSGLVGLAERAAGLRGSLEAGRRPEGGFRLRLSVPLPAAA